MNRHIEDDEDLTPEALARVALQAEIEELRARVSELEDWHSCCTCGAASRAGRDLVTRRQFMYIRGLASSTGADVDRIVQEKFGVEELRELTREQASELISSLQPDKKKTRRRNPDAPGHGIDDTTDTND